MGGQTNAYEGVFKKVFALNEETSLDELKYQGIPEWDSVGHMSLIAALETAFSIELDVDDVIDFSSFSTGKELLEKYGVSFN